MHDQQNYYSGRSISLSTFLYDERVVYQSMQYVSLIKNFMLQELKPEEVRSLLSGPPDTTVNLEIENPKRGPRLIIQMLRKRVGANPPTPSIKTDLGAGMKLKLDTSLQPEDPAPTMPSSAASPAGYCPLANVHDFQRHLLLSPSQRYLSCSEISLPLQWVQPRPHRVLVQKIKCLEEESGCKENSSLEGHRGPVIGRLWMPAVCSERQRWLVVPRL